MSHRIFVLKVSDLRMYGNNRVFCEGRFIGGPDVRSCAASFLLILFPSILWHIFVGPWFAEQYSAAWSLIGIILLLPSLSLLVASALTDPGILPRQQDFSECFDWRTGVFRDRQPPRYSEVVFRGHSIKLKYCTTCNLYRPPRCTHCSVCENCVERFDHHCPWIGNCIGRRNYRLFYCFVSFTALLNLFVLGTSTAQVVQLSRELQEIQSLSTGASLVQALSEEFISAALAIYCVGLVWFTVGLWGYHSYLVLTNQTTYEQIKGVNSESNPYDRGSSGNCADVLCSRVRPRYFNPFTNQLFWPKGSFECAKELSARQDSGDLGCNPATIIGIVQKHCGPCG